MSEPKVTLAEALARQRERPMDANLELAVVEFLELSDSEQKAVLFRELVHYGAQLDWIMAQLRK